MAQQLTAEIEGEFIYLDLENPRDLARLSDAELYLSENADKLICIDEIQLRPDLFNLLRSLIDRDRRAGRFIILGSASPDLLRGSADSLAGRIAYVELSPLSFMEIEREIDRKTHWLRGGYPDALLAKNNNEAMRWLKNYIQTYVQRDLGQLGLNVSSVMVFRLLSLLSHIHGNLINFSSVSRSLAVDSKTTKNYIDFLTESFLLNELQPFHTNTKKRLVKSPKFYYKDSGILHYLHRIPNYSELLGHPIAGASWEGYVVEEIQRKFGDDFQYFFYRTQRGAECDLILCQNMIPKISVEIKLSNAPTIGRGYHESLKDLGTEKNFIVTPNSERFSLSENVEAVSFEEFLKIKF